METEVSTYYVICITKIPNHTDPHTSIQSYGVSTDVNAKKPAETWTQSKMIEVIEKKDHIVKSMGLKPGSKTEYEFPELEVVTKSDKSKYVKSKNDGDRPDNLLSRPECSSLAERIKVVG